MGSRWFSNERLERFLATGHALGIPELGGKRWSDVAAMNDEEAEAWTAQMQSVYTTGMACR